MVEPFLHLLIRWATFIYISRCSNSSPCNEDNSMWGIKTRRYDWVAPLRNRLAKQGCILGRHRFSTFWWLAADLSVHLPISSLTDLLVITFSYFSSQLGLGMSSHLLVHNGASEWGLRSVRSTLESMSVSWARKDRYSPLTSRQVHWSALLLSTTQTNHYEERDAQIPVKSLIACVSLQGYVSGCGGWASCGVQRWFLVLLISEVL